MPDLSVIYRVDHERVREVTAPYRAAIERGEEPDLSALADELCRKCVRVTRAEVGHRP